MLQGTAAARDCRAGQTGQGPSREAERSARHSGDTPQSGAHVAASPAVGSCQDSAIFPPQLAGSTLVTATMLYEEKKASSFGMLVLLKTAPCTVLGKKKSGVPATCKGTNKVALS